MEEELKAAKEELAKEREGRRSAGEVPQEKDGQIALLNSSMNPDTVAEVESFHSEKNSYVEVRVVYQLAGCLAGWLAGWLAG